MPKAKSSRHKFLVCLADNKARDDNGDQYTHWMVFTFATKTEAERFARESFASGDYSHGYLAEAAAAFTVE